MAHLLLGLVVLLCGGCGTSGVRIINCNNNSKIEIFEDSPDPVTCGDINSTATVEWRGDGNTIGECGADGMCTDSTYGLYTLKRSPQSTDSQLTLISDYRGYDRVTVTCQDRLTSSSSDCTLVILRHSVLSECQVTITNVDWTVTGSCRVQEAFSSDDIYTCTWTRNDVETFGEFDASRELCSFTQPLPQAGGLYTYSISVSPPATTTFSQQLRLAGEGPDDVIISKTHQPGSNGSSVVTVSCNTAGAMNFTWGAGVCQNETHHTRSSTCTIFLDANNDGKSVRCIATNSNDNRISVSSMVTLWLNETENVNDVTAKINSPSAKGPVAGAVVAVVLIAVIATLLVVFIRRRRRHLKTLHDAVQYPRVIDEAYLVTSDSQLHSALTPPSDNHGYEDRNRIEEGAAAQLTNVYENIHTLADKTYDTPRRPYQEHQYADLKVKVTDEVEVTTRGPPDGEERDSTVYINV